MWLGARALPFTLATAPAATSLRNAPAALLAATQDQAPAGRDRFLSLSDIRFDPGDLAELRASQAGRLSPDAVERLVRAAKQVEVIAPNLPLLYNLPAVDGYDGGLLPLGRYVQLQSLFLPPELLMPDGRLREQLRGVPDDRLLDLTGVRFVVTDKQRDLWADDVYYDLELGARLEPGQELASISRPTRPSRPPRLGVVAEAANDVPDGTRLAELTVTGADGREETLDLRAPRHAGGAHAGAPAPADPLTPISLTVRVPADAPATVLRGISLIDERTGAHSSVTVSQDGDFRRIHSGDVKIYERTGGARAAPGSSTACSRPRTTTHHWRRWAIPRSIRGRRWCCPMGAIPGRQHVPPQTSRCRSSRTSPNGWRSPPMWPARRCSSWPMPSIRAGRPRWTAIPRRSCAPI